MFEETFELEYVIELLRGYAEARRLCLSPKQIQQLHDNSPLPVLTSRLRKALVESGIDASKLTDSNEVMQLQFVANMLRLNNLQEAQIGALRTILAAPDPADWDEKRLLKIELQLKTIHCIEGDIARSVADGYKPFRKGRKRGSYGLSTKIIGELVKRNPDTPTKKLWRNVLMQDKRVIKVSDDCIQFSDMSTLTFNSFKTKVSNVKKLA